MQRGAVCATVMTGQITDLTVMFSCIFCMTLFTIFFSQNLIYVELYCKVKHNFRDIKAIFLRLRQVHLINYSEGRLMDMYPISSDIAL